MDDVAGRAEKCYPNSRSVDASGPRSLEASSGLNFSISRMLVNLDTGQNSQDDIQVAFLMGKARVTPLKSVTIPRLELTAAVLAVRMDLMLKVKLHIPLQNF